MAKTWHFYSDGGTADTIDEKTFVDHCRTGKITDATMVWTQGMDGWQSYADLQTAGTAAAEAATRKVAKAQAEAEAAGQVRRHPCAKCGKEWPEALMLQVRRFWVCRPCRSLELEEARKKAELAANRSGHFWTDSRFIVGFLLACAALYVPITLGYTWVRNYLNAPPTQSSEPWANQPRDQWPQLAVAADVRLRGWPQPLRAVNTCLVVGPQSRVLAVGFSAVFQGVAAQASAAPAAATPVAAARPTATHPAAATARAALPPEQMLRWFTGVLTEWSVGGAPPNRAVFTKVFGSPDQYGKSEALLLNADPPMFTSATLPATPLHLRTLPIQKGQTVYVVGSTPQSPNGKQNIRAGTLHAAFNAQKTLGLAMNTPVDPAALLGAPVLDNGGHLLGIVNGTLDPPDKNGQISSLSAESILSFAGPLDLVMATPAPGASPGAKVK